MRHAKRDEFRAVGKLRVRAKLSSIIFWLFPHERGPSMLAAVLP
jgi:hypothetical protein